MTIRCPICNNIMGISGQIKMTDHYIVIRRCCGLVTKTIKLIK